MAGTKIDNSAYLTSGWKSETVSKNLLKKGLFNLDISNKNSSSASLILAGSSIDIDGIIYEFDTDTEILGTLTTGINYLIITGGETAIASYTAIPIGSYNYIKGGYYGTSGERYIAVLFDNIVLGKKAIFMLPQFEENSGPNMTAGNNTDITGNFYDTENNITYTWDYTNNVYLGNYINIEVDGFSKTVLYFNNANYTASIGNFYIESTKPAITSAYFYRGSGLAARFNNINDFIDYYLPYMYIGRFFSSGDPASPIDGDMSYSGSIIKMYLDGTWYSHAVTLFSL